VPKFREDTEKRKIEEESLEAEGRGYFCDRALLSISTDTPRVLKTARVRDARQLFHYRLIVLTPPPSFIVDKSSHINTANDVITFG
jgi:glycine/D-amino acid oxidase-like deaminating enzyme